MRRIPSAGRGSVFAYEHELVRWLNGHEAVATAKAEPEARPAAPAHRRLVGLSLAIGLLLLGAFIIFFMRRDGDPVEVAGTSDPVAGDLYRSAEHEWQTRTPTGLSRAIAGFRGAIARDPHFANAYLGLADAYLLAREFGIMPAKAAYRQARDAATNALKLNPQSSGANAALAFVDFYDDHRVTKARQEFATAISLDPRDRTARHWDATFLMTIGDFKSAREQIEVAENLDSESTAIVADKALIMFYQGERKDAVRVLHQIESDQPSFASAHSYLSYINLIEGNDREYLRELADFANSRKDPRTAALAVLGSEALQHGGPPEMLRALLNERLTRLDKGEGSAYEIAQLCALLDQPVQALKYLETSITRREPEAIGMKIDLLLGRLRGRTEFHHLLSQIGLQR